MQKERQRLFYETLVQFGEVLPNEWIGKVELSRKVNGAYDASVGCIADPLYTINTYPTAHDICSLMNQDRLAINESLEFEKIILVKDNKFKIATLEETVAEEERIRKDAIKQLWRGSLIKAKRLQDGQIIIDFAEQIEKVIETFGGK